MKYHIITFGCQMNKSDSERIATLLEKKGCQSALKEGEADLIVVNMCSVRQSAVDRIFGLGRKLSKLKTKNKKLKTVLTGCILKKDKKKFENKFDLILNAKDLENWVKKSKKKKTGCSYFKIKAKSQSDSIAFIPISNGCNNFCSYCVVPFTRGPLVCRNHKEIIKEIKQTLKEKNIKEIWLLGQNVNDYNCPKNPKINFSKLIKEIDKIPNDFKLFFLSPHPKNFSNELIKTLKNSPKFGKQINLPLQSGDNEILKKMNRNYTAEDYKKLVEKILENIPEVRLSTDIIVGFPVEKKKHFKNTKKVFKEIKFSQAYIAKYSPRQGTAAFEMKDDVSLTEKKQREKELNA